MSFTFEYQSEVGLYFTCEFGLQVAAAGPVQSPADIMQRELDSCLSLEYTPESLPALLHQVGTSGRNTRDMHLQCIWVETAERPFKSLFLCCTVLHRQIVSLGSDQISAHAEVEEILPPHQRHREAFSSLQGDDLNLSIQTGHQTRCEEDLTEDARIFNPENKITLFSWLNYFIIQIFSWIFFVSALNR